MSADLALRLGHANARRLAGHDSEVDDLAQEAALAVVDVMRKDPEKPTAYLSGVARNRVRHLLVDSRRWTGMSGTTSSMDPLRRKGTEDLDALVEEPVVEAGFEDAVEWSTLRPEINAAIDALPGRSRDVSRRVVRLVMAGCSPSEAGRRIGVSPAAGRSAWAYARPQLANRLAHLKELVA